MNCSRPLLISAIALASISYAITHALTMRKHYRRPQCSANESCLYTAAGFRFALCDCPGENPTCPEAHSVLHQGLTYRFCQPRHLPICVDNQIATVVNGLQTAIHCLCPSDVPLRRVEKKIEDSSGNDDDDHDDDHDDHPSTIHYTCEIPISCTSNAVCATRSEQEEKIIHHHCRCPFEFQCIIADREEYGYCRDQ